MKFKEDDLQMSFAEYLDYNNLIWCHVANERKSSFQAGKRLKKKGVKSGVPDCLIFNPKGKYIGLAIELKIKPNKPTANQKKWLKDLTSLGWCCDVAYTLDEAIKITENYLNEKL